MRIAARKPDVVQWSRHFYLSRHASQSVPLQSQFLEKQFVKTAQQPLLRLDIRKLLNILKNE